MSPSDFLALTCIPLDHAIVKRASRYPFPGLLANEIGAGLYHWERA